MTRTAGRLRDALLITFIAASAWGDYDRERASAVARCAQIDPDETRTGLIFNPEGHRSYYVRSSCFMDAAVKFRDGGLCGEVRRRWLSLFSSSGVSKGRCRELVRAGLEQDRVELESQRRAYRRGHVRLRDFELLRNGNGRDFDIVPRFAGGPSQSYRLTFALLADGRRHQIYSDGFRLAGQASNIRIYVRQADVRRAFPAFALDAVYDLEATLTLAIGFGSPNGRWSDTFVERHFPAAERTQRVSQRVRFGDTTFRPEPVRR